MRGTIGHAIASFGKMKMMAEREPREGKGNLLFPDGSVLQASNSTFTTPGIMNRLSMPY